MNKDRRVRKRVLLVLLFLLLLLLGIFILWKVFGEERLPDWDDSLSQSDIGQIEYQGQKYSYNINLTNILFLGIDNNDVIRDDNMPGEAGQSDCIMILTLDKAKKKASILQIPRDTMTEIDLYDVNGEYRSTIVEQLATQYAYSIGGKSSCLAAEKTISELLYDLPIDGYLAMDMAGVPIFNDAVGGVKLTIPEDYTRIDPAFVKDATLTLTGKQAYDYVHYRDFNVDFSNNNRMERQKQYIPALIDAIRDNFKEDENYYKVLYPKVEEYVVTDLQGDSINRLIEYELDVENIKVIPGESKKGEVYEEFYVDQEKIQKFLLEMFYISEE